MSCLHTHPNPNGYLASHPQLWGLEVQRASVGDLIEEAERAMRRYAAESAQHTPYQSDWARHDADILGVLRTKWGKP